MEYQESYIASLKEETERIAKVAKDARKKGLDPTPDVEIRPADDVAGRVEGLVGPVGVAERIRELSEDEPTHKVAFEIAREIVQGTYGNSRDPEAAAEQAIRTALAILTEGITAGPIEGIASVKIKTNTDSSRYLAVYFAGPIRAAGGTEAAQTVIVADAVRQQLDLDRYKPSTENIERYVEEVDLYNRISHLQFPSKPEEVRLAARNIPVEVTGEATAEIEVTGYRDVPGVETNRLRGGAILVLNDSVLGKAHKLANQVSQLGLDGWSWLEGLTPKESEENQIEQRIQPKEKYLEDIIAGRPVLAYPSRKGGFRVRYGRSRNTGLAALGVHPATMVLLDNFIACGTQLIIERPGKGCVAMPVDSIHGPIVKLHNGSILRIDTVEEAKRIKDSVKKILFLGDLLIGFGEFRENNHLIVPSGYCPEWWAQETLAGLISASSKKQEELVKHLDKPTLTQLITYPLHNFPDPWQALAISSILAVPLHPRYLYFWEDLTHQQLQLLNEWVQGLTPTYDGTRLISLQGSLDPDIEEIIDSLCIPCEVHQKQIRFDEAAPILFAMFLGDTRCTFPIETEYVGGALDYLQTNWSIPLRPKGTFYIGARIGRPEKAKRRQMSPPPHGIFPVGNAGGAMRDVRKAEKEQTITVEVNLRLCPRCGETTFLQMCQTCEIATEQTYWCPICNQPSQTSNCRLCSNPANTYGPFPLPLKEQLHDARVKFGGKLPNRIKGVKGLMSKHKTPEILEKAILRAHYDLFVYKDGTIRFDMTDAPLTHFKPQEINISPDTLTHLGYHFDITGTPLHSNDQILELKTQDVIIPFDCAKYLFRVSQFIDDLLVQVYNLPPYYQLQSPEDLVEHLAVGLAPHTSAGIIARIIGFTPLRVCYAHPFWHAAKRRNCLSSAEEVLIWDTHEDQLLKLPLGQIVDDLLENGTPSQVVDDFGTLAIDNPYTHWRTISLDPTTHQPLYQPIKHWIKGTSHHWLQVTTHSGRTITMTPDHNALIWNPFTNALERIKAHQLQIGNQIPLLSSIPVPSKPPPQTINILQELANHLPHTKKFHTFKHQTRLRNAAPWMRQKLHQFALTLYNHHHNAHHTTLTPWKQTHTLKTYFTPLIPKQRRTPLFSPEWYKSIPLTHLEILQREGVFNWNDIPPTANLGMARDNHTISPYIPFNHNLIRLLGYYITEGYIRDEPTCYQTNFSVPHPHLRTHLKHLLQTTLGSPPYYKPDNHQLVHTGRIHAYLLAYAWKMGTNAYSKRLPRFVFSLNEELRLDFLSAYIDGDGSIPATDSCILFYSVSQKLLDDVGLLLSTLGVFYRHRKDPSPGRYGPSIIKRYKELDKKPIKQVVRRISVRGPDLLILERLKLMHPTRRKNAQRILEKGVPVDRVVRTSDGTRHTLGGISKTVFDIVADIQILSQEKPSYCLSVIPKNKQNHLYKNIQTAICITGNCDGDEDSLLLAMDPMVNFSRAFLPTSRGGSMDTPLVLSVSITPKEIDDEAHNIDGSGVYPLEFYERALQFVDPKDVEDIFDLVAHRIVDHRIESTAESVGLRFSHATGDVNHGPRVTMYTKLKTMEEKVQRQLALGKRIAAVDVQDMARRLLDSHFLPDIFGNIRAFSTQKFRCTSCNEKFRRIPLSGVCSKCGGKLVLTVTRAGITKYLELAAQVVKEYSLPVYYQQRLEMARRIIDSLFPLEEDEQQTTLRHFTPQKT
ncbi:MAG: DNA polymerase II large subunit [Candidatus Thorarchaeota archaeon]